MRTADWYALLNVKREATTEQIAAAVERLARQANALAFTGPERARQLRDQIRVIKQDLLAGTQARQRYDRSLAALPEGTRTPIPGGAESPSSGARAAGLMSRISKFLQTGWACAECGYSGLPGDKFCPKCGSKVTSGIEEGLLSRPRPPQAQVSRCDKCGNQAAPGGGFCTRCGNKLPPGVSPH